MDFMKFCAILSVLLGTEYLFIGLGVSMVQATSIAAAGEATSMQSSSTSSESENTTSTTSIKASLSSNPMSSTPPPLSSLTSPSSSSSSSSSSPTPISPPTTTIAASASPQSTSISPQATSISTPTPSLSSAASPQATSISTPSPSPSPSPPSPSPAPSPSASASTTPEMPKIYKQIEGSATLDYVWINAYSDTNSNEYKTLTRELTGHLTKVLKKSAAYKDDFLRVDVANFREGSVIFDYTVYLKITASVSEDNLKNVIKKGDDPKFIITSVSIKSVFPTDCPTSPTEKPETEIERWIIVLIICAFVIVILLIFVVIVMVQNRRLRKNLHPRKMSVFQDEDKQSVQTRMYSTGSTEIFQLSGPAGTPSIVSARPHGHELTTFSPENGDSNGTVSADSGEKETEKNGNRLRRDGDGEENMGYVPGKDFI